MAKRTHTTQRGPSQRQLRVGELIRRSLSEVLLRGDLHDEALAETSIIVSEARATPDLKKVTAYVSTLNGENEDEVLAALKRSAKHLRHEVMQGLNLKFAPALIFEIDRSFDRMDETRKMFSDPKVARDLKNGIEDG